MAYRLVTFFALAWFAAWVTLIYPLHERGRIVTPGSSDLRLTAACCSLSTPLATLADDAQSSGEPSPDSSAPRDPSRCLLCHQINLLLPPTPPTPAVCVTRLDVLPPIPAQSQDETHLGPDRLRGRAPPRSA